MSNSGTQQCAELHFVILFQESKFIGVRAKLNGIWEPMHDSTGAGGAGQILPPSPAPVASAPVASAPVASAAVASAPVTSAPVASAC